MKTEIILVRHAQPLKQKIEFKNISMNNELIPLSLNGEQASFKLAKKTIFNNVSVVISSNYVRCIGVAKYIAENNNCEFIIDGNLGERKMGTEEKIKDFWGTQLLDPNAKTIDGESQNEVKKRMLKVVNNVLSKYQGKKVVLVSHGAAITFLLMNWCMLDEFEINTKRRKLIFSNKVVINDNFKTPDVFKLTFVNDNLMDIKRIVV